VLCAAPVVGDEPFAVLLADDLIDAKVPVMAQMADVAARENCSVIGVMAVPRPIPRSGNGRNGRDGQALGADRAHRRKAGPGTTPSTGRGRALRLTGRVFIICAPCRPVPAADPVDRRHRGLIAERVLAYAFEGRRYDCGSKLNLSVPSITVEASGSERGFEAFL
jgi:UTP--glucose-1-phosphate uridylyltransferase